MASIILRASKGSPLTNAELDSNFGNLNADKIERLVDVNDNSDTALEIIQRGTAPGFVVKKTDLDTAPFVIDADGNVAIGKEDAAAGVKLDVVGDVAVSTKVIVPSVGPSGAQQHTLPAVASDTVILSAATQNVSNKAITGGSINNAPIGATTRSTGAFTTLAANGTSTFAAFSYSGEVTSTATSALQLPVGTTAQRPANGTGKIRFNTTLDRFEGFDTGANDWVALAGGATGAGADEVFFLNDKVVTQNYTIPANKNAGTFGPVTVADGVTVTVADGATWTIV